MCLANNEPLLAEAVIVQLGQGFVEKLVAANTISVDQLDVVTVKIMVYRDEFPLQWEEFVAAPIKHLVRLFPILARCDTAGCKCEAWHNTENLPIRDPILDVWR